MSVGKSVIITGGNSGLGLECARALAGAPGWRVILASRNLERVQAAVDELRAASGSPEIHGMQIDLASHASVRAFARAWEACEHPPLGALVCNAGVSPIKNQVTEDGVDFTFGVNHLGHYLLLHLLSRSFTPETRLVLVSSGTHVPGHPIASRLGVPAPRYVGAQHLAFPEDAPRDLYVQSPAQRYSTSKLCNVLCAYELARQLEALDLRSPVFTIDPGLMPGTGLMRDLPSMFTSLVFSMIRFAGRWVDGIRLPQDSGQDLARLVTSPELAARSSLYFDGAHEAKSSPDSYDRDKARDLWNTSAELCGLLPEESALALRV